MSENTNSNQKTKLIIASVVAVLLVAGVAGAGVLLNNNTSDDAKSDEVAVSSSSSSSSSDLLYGLPEIDPESINQREQADEVLNQRDELERSYTQSSINAEAILDGNFTTEEVVEAKEALGTQVTSVQSKPGQKVEITVDYTSIGDSSFENGTLIIKLSDGLSIVAGSMRDSLNGVGIVEDTVYDAQNSIVKYGPGTGNQESSAVAVGDKGTFTFVVEVSQDASSNLAVTSFMQENGGRLGVPGIIFIDA